MIALILFMYFTIWLLLFAWLNAKAERDRYKRWYEDEHKLHKSTQKQLTNWVSGS